MKDLLKKFYDSCFNTCNIKTLAVISMITALLSEKFTTVLLVDFIYILCCFSIFYIEKDEKNVYVPNDDNMDDYCDELLLELSDIEYEYDELLLEYEQLGDDVNDIKENYNKKINEILNNISDRIIKLKSDLETNELSNEDRINTIDLITKLSIDYYVYEEKIKL